MSQSTLRLIPLLALALVAGLVACDEQEAADYLLAPTAVPAHEASESEEDGEKVTEDGYTGLTKAAAWVESSGGSLSLAGHSLVVPEGAVSQPMCFTMELGTGDYVDVDLHAWQMESSDGCDAEKVGGDEWSGTIWTGEFQTPVKLTLTYSRATNVSDPGALVVAWQKSSTTMELLSSSVDEAAETVSAGLDHFSEYLLAFP